MPRAAPVTTATRPANRLDVIVVSLPRPTDRRPVGFEPFTGVVYAIPWIHYVEIGIGSTI